jgi:oligosaccharide 4-alpha-D-glucosyltransferase
MNSLKILFVVILLHCFSLNTSSHTPTDSFADPVCRNYSFDGEVLTIFSDYCDITVQPFTDDIIKVLWHVDGKWETDTSFSIIAKSQKPIVNFNNYSTYLEFSTKNLMVKINKDPILFYYYRGDSVVMQDFTGFFKHQGFRGVKLKLWNNEKIYGGGSRALPMNRRGYNPNMFNENRYFYEFGTEVLNSCIPFFTSSRMYGLYLDNHSFTYVHAGSITDSVFQCNSKDLEFSYYFINGSSYQDILNKYIWLTGSQPLPPRWAFGYFQSKYNYIDQVNVMKNLLEMRVQGFPIDAVVHDLGWFRMMGDFDWNKERFPRVAEMLDSLKQIGIKTILISECYVSGKSKNFDDAKSKNLFTFNDSGKLDPTFIMDSSMYLLDFTNEKALSWIWDLYNANISQGIDGWWFDLGEPECHNWLIRHKLGIGYNVHNIYSLLWYRKIFEGYRTNYKNTRPVLLTRAGWAGLQRYGALPVCGDEARTWSSLRAQVPVMLGMSMSGSAYMHSDGGGFTGMYQGPNPEIYVRWLQFITFQPIMRVHMSAPVQAEPIFWPDSVKNIVREYVKLRYKLLPYNYTLAWKNSEFGVPLAIPMNFDYPDKENLSNVNDQYFWGDNFLVAPILDSGARKRDVILPEGNWINYWTGEKHKGNQTITVDAPLDIMPLFVRSGCFIPTVPPMMTTEQYNGDTLIIQYYPDIDYESTTYTMYDDDGKTPEANLKNLYELIEFGGKAKNNNINISVKKSGYSFEGAPAKRNLTFEIFRPEFKPGLIFIGNEYIRTYKDFYDFILNDTSAYYNSATNKLFIKYTWGGDASELNITDLPAFVNDENLSESGLKIISVQPNPTSGKAKLNYYSSKDTQIEIDISDLTGKLNNSMKVNCFAGINSQDIETGQLPAGSYIIILNSLESKDIIKFIRINK